MLYLIKSQKKLEKIMNEFEIVNKYFRKLAINKASLNLNDDIFFDKKNKLAVSTDTYFEKTHFLNFKKPGQVIKKIIRSSISDLICKGVYPKYIFICASGNKHYFTKKNIFVLYLLDKLLINLYLLKQIAYSRLCYFL